MQWKNRTGLLLLLFTLSINNIEAQVVGGVDAFEYLRLSNSPHVSALGGIVAASSDDDVSLAMQNPALMRPALHNELTLNYDSYYAGISIANLQYGYHVPSINTSFILGIQYINYGSFTQTDYIGNQYGDFRASDYAISIGASRKYLNHWRYGADLKWAHSNLYVNTASAILMDVGIDYMDTATLWNFGVVAKNMGVMVRRYNTSIPAEPLPFDLQMGVSKQFKHLPLRLFATLHHLYQWDVVYNNPADVTQSLLTGSDTSNKASSFSDKLFRHFIFGGELTLGKRLELTVSYNVLRRNEMAITERPAAAGFAFGAGLNLNKFQIHYARSYYSIAGAYNEFGITLAMNKLMGVGNEKMHWTATYPDWE